MGEIYLLTFSNGKRYVGATTVGARKRFAGHRGAAASGATTPVCAAWRKHGEPRIEVVCVVENSALINAEEKAIKQLNTLVPNGYNRAEKSNAAGVVVSPATRRKLAASKTGRVLSEETRAKIGNAHRGKIMSAASRLKMSAWRKGRKKHEGFAAIIAKENAKRFEARQERLVDFVAPCVS